MDQKSRTTDDRKGSQPVMTNDTADLEVTAQPKDQASTDAAAADRDLAGPMEYGEMNLEDAKASGYTDENGKAVSMARKDVEGSPTGGYTDIGAGRSSAVHKVSDKKSETHH